MSSSGTGTTRKQESIAFPILGDSIGLVLKRDFDDNRAETSGMSGFLTETESRTLNTDAQESDLYVSTGSNRYLYDAAATESYSASGSVTYESDDPIYVLEKECLYIKVKQSWTYQDTYTFTVEQNNIDSRSSASLEKVIDFLRYVYTPYIETHGQRRLLDNRSGSLTRVLTNFAYNAVRSFFNNQSDMDDKSDRFQVGLVDNAPQEWHYFHVDDEGNEFDKVIDTSDSFCFIGFTHDGDWQEKPLPEEGDVITMSSLSVRAGYGSDQFLSYDWANTCTMTETKTSFQYLRDESDTNIAYSGIKSPTAEYTNFWNQINSGTTECWLVAYGEYINDSQEFDPYGVPVYVYSCTLDSVTRVLNQDTGAFKRDGIASIQITVTSGSSEESVFCLRELFNTANNNEMRYVVFPKVNAASLLITYLLAKRSFSSNEAIQPYLRNTNLVNGKFFITNEFRTQFRLSNDTEDNGADTFELEGIAEPGNNPIKVKWLKAKNKYTNPNDEKIGVTAMSPDGFSSGVNPFVSFYPVQKRSQSTET